MPDPMRMRNRAVDSRRFPQLPGITIRGFGELVADGLVAMDGSKASFLAVDAFEQRSHIEGIVGFTVANARVGQIDHFTTHEL